MEEKRKNTGLVVLITILVLIILGLTGFIVYDKVLKNDKVESNTSDSDSAGIQQDIDDLKKEALDDSKISISSLENVIGNYHYVKKSEAVSGPENATEYYNTDSFINLKDDYTFEILDTTHCQTSVGYKGTYQINGSSIILTGFEDNYSDRGYLGKLWIFGNDNINSETEIVIAYNNDKLVFGDVIMVK